MRATAGSSDLLRHLLLAAFSTRWAELGRGRTGLTRDSSSARRTSLRDTVRHQRAPPGEETHDPNPGPHEQGAQGSAARLHSASPPHSPQHHEALPAQGVSWGQAGPTQALLASLSHEHREHPRTPRSSAASGQRPRTGQPALGGRRSLCAEAGGRGDDPGRKSRRTEALSRPHWSPPCGTMNAPALFRL